MSENMRIINHSILTTKEQKEVVIYYEGKPLVAYENETVAATLLAYGVRVFRYTSKKKEPRGIYCANGQCSDCMMIINGVPSVRTCVTYVEEGMTVERQHGLGK